MAISPILFIGLICVAGSAFLFPAAEAIWLTVPSSGEKCISEEIQANVVVLAYYYCIDQDKVDFGPTLDVRVTSPYGNELYKRVNETAGEFAFTTSESGTYIACFSMHHDQSHYTPSSSVIISLDWKIGIRAKDWDSVAKKEKIEGVELDLRKSEAVVNGIKANMLHLKLKEAYAREINEKTNKRVAQLGFFSIGVSLIVSVFQVLYLKRFFLKKKLI
ncbi:unnamed protein product [Microthlaspi erraticum]|uniref:GOLD domain-containing protein n=1 Tax=Microthlaspi erraticum TaxID=1685480 RepID=A0A6D2L2N8_9BRAS|nr:unnamed protein product [Microthlaspi erraticum]